MRAGDRVLLVADPVQRVLVVHPMAALDAMVVGYHETLLGGEDR
ncbi:hypothetical protein SAMN05421504_11153 [Amycolatopsis xylanica]|uniref:Uncharacterized protein n=1 Tax=Amycolatopsis xylanica TaxID=589385 RepID=A0A1H3RGI2_9PSEU|nr:hypothetical protein SAMN05421504_11153 [Amycolatopsis xylanica]